MQTNQPRSTPSRLQPGVGSVGFRHRSAFKLLTALNAKSIKGEKAGYLSAILYLMPHTSGGGATLCPYSTEACREMCLAGAGLSGLPKQLAAKMRRTVMFNDHRRAFLTTLQDDIEKLKRLAAAEGLRPAVRLNGSSDVLWEALDWNLPGLGLQRYDYTKIPLAFRRTDPAYHLTFSVEGPDSMALAVDYLRAGHSIALVVPEEVKASVLAHDTPALRLGPYPGQFDAPLVDGDLTDLRFLDPPRAVVLLKPKGHVRTSLIRPNFMRELTEASFAPPRRRR